MRMSAILAHFCLAVGLLLPGTILGQSVGSWDLTSELSVPQERLPSPSAQACDKVRSSISEGSSSDLPEAEPRGTETLELSIVSVSPAALVIGEEFIANVRLKNTGMKPVLVPSLNSGEQISPGTDASREEYEVADITFRLASGKNRTPIFLDSSGALFARPTDKGSYLALNPGNWVDLKVKGTVTCGAAKCLADIQPDGKAVLSGWWYQRILTHRVNGCDENHGTYEVRELNSTPFNVVVREGAPKTRHIPNRNHASTHVS